MPRAVFVDFLRLLCYNKKGENILIPLYDNEDSVCGIIYNNVPYKKIKSLKKKFPKGNALKNEKIKVKAKYKILGQRIEMCINIPDNICSFVSDVIKNL